MKKKMPMKSWEGSPADRKMDKKLGFKEGSAKDNAADRKAVKKANSGKVAGVFNGNLRK